MPTVTVSFNDQKLIKRLSTIGSGLESYREPLDEIGTELLDFYGGKVFESQGSELGVRWRPLAPATLKMRAERRGYYSNPPVDTNKILVWTGKLKAGFRKAVSRFKLVVDNPDPKFAWNHATRPMLGITKKVTDLVVIKMEQYLRSLIVK